MKLKKTLRRTARVLAFLALAIGAAAVFSPTYLRRAAMNGLAAQIDDYTIFPNRPVRASEEQPWEFAPKATSRELPEAYAERFMSYEPIALLIERNEKIVFEKYWDGYDQNSYSNSFSMAKSVVSMLVGIAIGEGKIESVQQKVSDFLPEYKDGPRKDLTVESLLMMSSGLNWVESYTWKQPFSETARAYFGDDVAPILNGMRMTEEQGRQWKYLSGNTQALAAVVQAATGKSVSEYASEKLWKPLGARHDALWSLDHEGGMEKAFCCFNSNARDFARLGRLALDTGVWRGKRLVPRDYMLRALSPNAHLRTPEGYPVDFYGYQFWIVEHKGMRVPYFRGILGQYVFLLYDYDAVVVRLGHKRDDQYMDQHPKDVFLYLDMAVEILEEGKRAGK